MLDVAAVAAAVYNLAADASPAAATSSQDLFISVCHTCMLKGGTVLAELM